MTALVGCEPSASAAGQALLEPPYTAFGVDYDDPPDGQYDAFVVEASLNVSAPGLFAMTVHFPWGGVFSRAYPLDFGVHRVQVYVEGYVIRERRVDGPYNLNLSVTNEDNVQLDTTSFTTGLFLATDYEDFDVEYKGTTTDFPVDTDVPPNGLFDYLVIDIPLTVREFGEYEVRLDFGPGYRNMTWLSPGDRTVRILVPGFKIWQLHLNGQLSMRVELEQYKFSSYLSGLYDYRTQSYDWTMFEPPPAYILSAGDFGIDTDVPPDGLFDYLGFRAQVVANRSGDYKLEAYLMDSVGDTFDLRSETRYIAEGQGEIELRFSPHEIVNGNFDGPYVVSFNLRDENELAIVGGTNNTQPYRWTDFGLLPVQENGPVQDEYRDTDVPPDGVIDYYIAKVPVNVAKAGYYIFEGLALNGSSVRSRTSGFYAVGSATVELSWPAGLLGPTGPPPGSTARVLARAPADVLLFQTQFTMSPAPGGSTISSPPISIVGVPTIVFPDQDADGLYDSLEVQANVNASRTGQYAFLALLAADSNGFRVGYAANHTTLNQGPNVLRLDFPGWAIRASGVDGPYYVLIRWLPGPSDSPWPYEFSAGESTMIPGPLVYHYNFDDDRPSVESKWVSAPPAPDGQLSPGEWPYSNATELMTTDSGAMQAKAYVANDAESLYVALDAVGDTTEDFDDSASVSFDAGSLDSLDPKGDDQIGVGFSFRLRAPEFRLTAFFKYFYDGWAVRQSPFDSAPGREHLKAAIGFGSSPRLSTPHRIYEFLVPLAMLGVRPGDDLGVAVYSIFTGGIVDGTRQRLSWPTASIYSSPFRTTNFARLSLAPMVVPPNEPPVVSIENPTNNTIASRSITVSGIASDSDGSVREVEVRVDDGDWKNATGTTAWTYELDTRTVTDGVHTVIARAYDGRNYSTEVPVRILVDNTAPLLTIVSPANNSIEMTKTVNMQWTAYDATSGIDHFEVSIDGGSTVVLGALNSSYLFPNLTDGSHCATVKVFDRTGNYNVSSVNFTVNTMQGPGGTSNALVLAGVAIVVIVVIAAVALLLRKRREDEPPEGSEGTPSSGHHRED